MSEDQVGSSQAAGATPAAEPLGDGGIKALEAERKARRDAEHRAKELEAQLAQRDRDDLIATVAAEKGLPDGLARRLTGDSREALEADADELLAALPGATPPPSKNPVPRAPRSPLLDPDAEPDPVAIAEKVFRRGV